MTRSHGSTTVVPTDAELDRAIAGLLRGVPLSDAALAEPEDRLLHRIDLHGAAPLLALRSTSLNMPASLVAACRTRLVAREFWEAQHERILREALDALAQAGLTPLLFKGTALAWSHYPTPAARVRGDSDVLVEEEGRDAAIVALERAGFTQSFAAGGTTLVAEVLFRKADATGSLHDIDVHWRLNSSPVLARAFPHGDLAKRAVAVPGLGGAAWRVSDVDALLIACFHRRKHLDGTCMTTVNGIPYPTPDSLTWLMDIDFLFRTLDPDARAAFLQAAEDKSLAEVCLKALSDVGTTLGTPVPEDVSTRLGRARGELPEAYLNGSPIGKLLRDWTATKGVDAKAMFLTELAFPPPDYMRKRFGRGPLPLLYLRRGLGGLSRLWSWHGLLG